MNVQLNSMSEFSRVPNVCEKQLVYGIAMLVGSEMSSRWGVLKMGHLPKPLASLMELSSGLRRFLFQPYFAVIRSLRVN